MSKKLDGLDMFILNSNGEGGKVYLSLFWEDDVALLKWTEEINSPLWWDIIRGKTREELSAYCGEVSRRQGIIHRHLIKLWRLGYIKLGLWLAVATGGGYTATFNYKKCWDGCPCIKEKPDCSLFSIACPGCHEDKKFVKWATFFEVNNRPLELMPSC